MNLHIKTYIVFFLTSFVTLSLKGQYVYKIVEQYENLKFDSTEWSGWVSKRVLKESSVIFDFANQKFRVNDNPILPMVNITYTINAQARKLTDSSTIYVYECVDSNKDSCDVVLVFPSKKKTALIDLIVMYKEYKYRYKLQKWENPPRYNFWNQ